MSTTTRLVSPPSLAGDGTARRSHSRSQRPINLEVNSDAGGGAASQHIRPTTSSSPPLIPISIPISHIATQSRRTSTRRSSIPTTTQQPRPSPSLSPSLSPLPGSNQTPLWRRQPNRPPSPRDDWINHYLNEIPDAHDDEYRALDLLTGEFSSPSTYPSFLNPDSRQSQSQSVSQFSARQASTPQPLAFTNASAVAATTSTAAPRGPSINRLSHININRTTSQLSSSTNTAAQSQSTLRTLDSFDEQDLFDSPASSFSDAMPPTLRRTTTAAAARTGSVHTNKRRRTSMTAPAPPTRSPSIQKPNPLPKKNMEVEELFGSSPPCSRDTEAKNEYATIDLTETNEVPEGSEKPEKDNRIKLSAFQCVICMDDCTNLTVTHCGE
ncbi:hypothetical protein F66182_10075 [Fusarium sp. NRRL 66182]|nr:hypothetical protein F66182_10075 [Fusarium sp. NRRL 66182]